MLLPLGLISIVATAWLMGWGLLRVLLLGALIWAIVLIAMLAAPASEIGRFGMIDVSTWAATGILIGAGLLYAGFIRKLRLKAAARWGGPQQAATAAAANGKGLIPSDAYEGAKSADALDRYARHYVLREIGGPGQAKLRDASVLVIGAGGLGAPAVLYLAAAGVGRITIADPDTVSISNLQRQVIYRTEDAGRPKGLAAVEALRALNPYIDIHAIRRQITNDDADMIAGFDLVLDGTDSFSAREAINSVCVAAGVPLIAGAISQWEGQLSIYDPAGGSPCFSCVFPERPAPGLALPCAEAGVIGPLPGVIGSMMALEAIKHITGAGKGLSGQMLIYDGLYGETRIIRIHRRDGCPVCSGVAERLHEA
ncbi:MAG: HesA/MoeB/ThiF family protein [Paracoccus sp. (in: a-proteobacteria)]